MQKDPTITVLMPLYNAGPYLSEAIESILAQSYRDFEFLIVDDCSTDGSSEVLSVYAGQDSRIRVLRNEKNLGLIRALNTGLRAARGKYIARQDADDRSRVDRLKKELQVMECRPEVGLVTCAVAVIDSTGKKIGLSRPAIPPFMVPWWFIFWYPFRCAGQLFFRREIDGTAFYFDEKLHYCDDYKLCTTAAHSSEIVQLGDVLYDYRLHGTQQTQECPEAVREVTMQIAQDKTEYYLLRRLDRAEMTRLRSFWYFSLDISPDSVLPLLFVLRDSYVKRKKFAEFPPELVRRKINQEIATRFSRKSVVMLFRFNFKEVLKNLRFAWSLCGAHSLFFCVYWFFRINYEKIVKAAHLKNPPSIKALCRH